MIVTDGSLQRAMSLARSALREGGVHDGIRTHARRGYRFSLDVEVDDDSSAARVPERLRSAREAYDRGEWPQAVERFAEADRADALGAADLERWALGIQLAGAESDAVGPLERAVAAYSVVGDRRGAARSALMLAQIQLEWREAAVAVGWYRRAESLLAGVDESREHGFLAWLGSRIAAVEGRLQEAMERADRAVELGTKIADPDIEALGLLCRGLVLLALGEVEPGVALHDEAAAAVLSGGVGPWAGGLIYCGIVSSCRNRGDWPRAVPWTDHFGRWCTGRGLSAFPALCQLYRAEVFGFQGQLGAAEREAAEACAALAASAPWAEGDAYRVRGDLLLFRGDLDEAEKAFRRSHELSPATRASS